MALADRESMTHETIETALPLLPTLLLALGLLAGLLVAVRADGAVRVDSAA